MAGPEAPEVRMAGPEAPEMRREGPEAREVQTAGLTEWRRDWRRRSG